MTGDGFTSGQRGVAKGRQTGASQRDVATATAASSFRPPGLEKVSTKNELKSKCLRPVAALRRRRREEANEPIPEM